MDKETTKTRRYIAERAELLGAIRLPNNAFKGIANTEVTSDIIFLQKHDTPLSLGKYSDEELKQHFPWIFTEKISGINRVNSEDVPINSYFVNNSQMVLGEMIVDNGNRMHGAFIPTCKPFEDRDLSKQLKIAVTDLKPAELITPVTQGHIGTFEIYDTSQQQDQIPIFNNPMINEKQSIRNYSYILGNVGSAGEGRVYFNEALGKLPEDITDSLSDLQKERMTGLIGIKDTCRALIDAQLNNHSDEEIKSLQAELNFGYDDYAQRHGLINSRTAKQVFAEDSSYPLLCALEVLNSDGEFIGKSAMFTKRTINPLIEITHADTAEEALIASMSERGKVDVPYMEKLTNKIEEELFSELIGLGKAYKDIRYLTGIGSYEYKTADEYLSGNVRKKLQAAEALLKQMTELKACLEENNHGDISEVESLAYQKYIEITANIVTVNHNIAALKQAIPKQIESSDIDVRFGTTWIPANYIGEFISEKLNIPRYSRGSLGVAYNRFTSTWGLNNNKCYVDNVLSTEVYGTRRIEAINIMVDTLNFKDIKIYDTDSDGNKNLNYSETVLAQEKQKKIKKEFIDWIWDNSDRRADLVEIYNNRFNAICPREYDGSNLRFEGMSPEINLKPHQKNAVARILYGGHTLLAHEVGLGKTYEMIAAAMESKRLGLCSKSLITVPKHLTEQFGSDFLKVYPNANVLIVRDNEFTLQNRKKFCAKIATGNYDAIVMAHSQFEKIPLSLERQENFIQSQLDKLEYARDEEREKGYGEQNRFTIKQLEKRKRQLETKLERLMSDSSKDDTITFEELGIDKIFVDEAHMFKNLYYQTKLTGVAGLSQSESNRATDMFMKCRYLDEKTGGKGITMATGTPLSNSLAEMFTMQRFLQFDTLEEQGLYSFDDWASSFGDVVTSYEIAPEGNGKYRERRRFAEFFNLPELMNIFTQVADIKTSDTVDIPKPITHRHTVVAQPDDITKEYINLLSERAEAIQKRMVRPEEDNMLAVTNDGRKIGLDVRLMNNLLPDNPQSKLNMCVQNVFDIWHDTKDDKLTQLLFSDLSTPKTSKGAGFNIYDDIREKLVVKGIPREEVKFIHEAKNDAQKKVLFEKVRNGEVRILLGSTEKMGSGTNVQNRLYALHNLDCPWRPSDLERASVMTA